MLIVLASYCVNRLTYNNYIVLSIIFVLLALYFLIALYITNTLMCINRIEKNSKNITRNAFLRRIYPNFTTPAMKLV